MSRITNFFKNLRAHASRGRAEEKTGGSPADYAQQLRGEHEARIDAFFNPSELQKAVLRGEVLEGTARVVSTKPRPRRLAEPSPDWKEDLSCDSGGEPQR